MRRLWIICPLFISPKSTEKTEYLAMVFTDETAGKETCGEGCELVVKTPNGISDGMSLSIDFNQTLNFYCAHSPFWHCPVGLQKFINVSVKAGEKLPRKKIISLESPLGDS